MPDHCRGNREPEQYALVLSSGRTTSRDICWAVRTGSRLKPPALEASKRRGGPRPIAPRIWCAYSGSAGDAGRQTSWRFSGEPRMDRPGGARVARLAAAGRAGLSRSSCSYFSAVRCTRRSITASPSRVSCRASRYRSRRAPARPGQPHRHRAHRAAPAGQFHHQPQRGLSRAG